MVIAENICTELQRMSFDILPLQLHGLVDNTCAQPDDWDGQKHHGQLGRYIRFFCFFVICLNDHMFASGGCLRVDALLRETEKFYTPLRSAVSACSKFNLTGSALPCHDCMPAFWAPTMNHGGPRDDVVTNMHR